MSEVTRLAASANRHVKTITGRMLSADAARTTLDGINPSIHRGAAAPAANAGPETPVETGSPSDASAGRRSRPETPTSVNRADTTSNAAKTAGIASPSRPDWLFLPRRAPTARKSCDTIRGSTMARSAFVQAPTSTSSAANRESDTGWGYSLARRPTPRPASRVRLRLSTDGTDMRGVDIAPLLVTDPATAARRTAGVAEASRGSRRGVRSPQRSSRSKIAAASGLGHKRQCSLFWKAEVPWRADFYLPPSQLPPASVALGLRAP